MPAATLQQEQRRLKWAMLSPALFFIIAMIAFPLFYTAYLSTTDAFGAVNAHRSFLGLTNFSDALGAHDPDGAAAGHPGGRRRALAADPGPDRGHRQPPAGAGRHPAATVPGFGGRVAADAGPYRRVAVDADDDAAAARRAEHPARGARGGRAD